MDIIKDKRSLNFLNLDKNSGKTGRVSLKTALVKRSQNPTETNSLTSLFQTFFTQ